MHLAPSPLLFTPPLCSLEHSFAFIHWRSMLELNPAVPDRMYLLNSRRLARRTFLRAGAVSIALPLLEAMLPRGLRATSAAEAMAPRRLLLVARVLGTNADYFFPRKVGPNFEATRYLKWLERHRGRFTVISGMSHLGYASGHRSEAGLFTGVAGERIQRVDFIRNTVSLDQLVAEKVGSATRFSGLAMGSSTTVPMVFNRNGVPVPTENRPEEVFRRLFLQGTPESVAAEARRLRDGRSILDQVQDQLKGIARSVGSEDRARLDLLAVSIREAEQEIHQSEAWSGRPLPKVDRVLEDFRNPRWSSSQRMRYDLAALAFQTDSTRVAVALESPGDPGDAPGATLGHHDASHHGKDPRKLEELALFEEEETRNFAVLLDKLVNTREGNGTLLDRTIVFWGSNLGNPSAHACDNLPILVAGGGFKHQGHLSFDSENNQALSNLYLRFLHQLGIEQERFGSSTRVFSELG